MLTTKLKSLIATILTFVLLTTASVVGVFFVEKINKATPTEKSVLALAANETSDSYMIYASNGDGTCSVKAKSKSLGNALTIPETSPAGDTVTSVQSTGFGSHTTLTRITIPGTVKEIGSYAFQNCTKLSMLTINEGVELIKASAFSGCTALTRVRLPDGITTLSSQVFNGCTNISELTVPETVTSIGDAAFQNCKKLTSFDIPSGVTSIGDNAFYSCSSLTSITIPSGVTSMGTYAFYSCTSLTSITLPSSVTSIGDSAFRNCTSLTSITIPSGVTSIVDRMVQGCTSLTSITIPSDVTSIGNFAFYGCSSITSMTIPANVTSIGNGAFCDCLMTSIIIPSCVTSIGVEAFWNCTKLTSIVIESADVYTAATGTETSNAGGILANANWVYVPKTIVDNNTNTYLNGSTFNKFESDGDWCIFYKSLADEYSEKLNFAYFTQLYSYTITTSNNISGDFNIPGLSDTYEDRYGTIIASVQHIGQEAFDSRSITSVFIPPTVTVIGERAFYQTELKSVVIPDSVIQMDSRAFHLCVDLKYVKLPNNLETISDNAFSGCVTLPSITIPANVTTIRTQAFDMCYELAEVTIESQQIYSQITDMSESCGGLLKYAKKIRIPVGVYNSSVNAYLDGTDFLKTLSADGTMYTITPRQTISLDNTTVTIPDVTYTGSEQTPEATVMFGEVELVKDTDYTIGYTNNVNAGTATATIVGIGNYTGTITKNFTINKRQMKLATSLESVEVVSASYGAGTYVGNVTKFEYSIDGLVLTISSLTYTGTNGETWEASGTVTFNESLTKIESYSITFYRVSYSGTSSFSANSAAMSNNLLTTCVTAGYQPSVTIRINPEHCFVNIPNQTYIGDLITPEEVISFNGTQLINGTDYSITYSNNINAGTATATITGLGNFTGSAEKTFVIDPKNFSDELYVQFISPEQDSASEPRCVVTNLGDNTYEFALSYVMAGYGKQGCTVTAKFNEDFTEIIEWSSTVSGTYSYEGGILTYSVGQLWGWKVQLLIIPPSLNIAVSDIPNQALVNGGAKPDVQVRDEERGELLVLGTDYTLSYENNTSVGTATVVITGKGNYTGTYRKTFEITSKDLTHSDIELDPIADMVYNQEAPSAVVMRDKATGYVLQEGVDFYVAFSMPEGVGIANVVITAVEGGNYSGERTSTVKIVPATIGNATVSMEKEEEGKDSYTYTGAEIRPNITVMVETPWQQQLELNSDYTLTFSNNINVGTATVTIKGIGNYTGTKIATFYISAKDIASCNSFLSFFDVTYDGNSHKPTVEIRYWMSESEEITLQVGVDYTLKYRNEELVEMDEFIAVGDYHVLIEGIGNYTGSFMSDFHITPADMSTASVALDRTNFTYDGNAHIPAVTVTLGGKELTTVDYSYTIRQGDENGLVVESPIEAGIYFIVVTGKGTNFSSGKVSASFVIEALDVEQAEVETDNLSFVYNGNLQVPTINKIMIGDFKVDASLLLIEHSSDSTNVGEKTLTITGDTNNFFGTKTITYNITSKSISNILVENLFDKIYSGEEALQDVMIFDNDLDRYLVEIEEYEVRYENNINAGNATIVIAGVGNFQGEFRDGFQILKAEITEVVLQSNEVTYNGAAQKPAILSVKADQITLNADDYTISYFRGDAVESKFINAGIITVEITAAENSNFEGSVQVEFKINKAQIDNITLTSTRATFNLQAQPPVVDVVSAGNLILNQDEYKLTYYRDDEITRDFTQVGTIRVEVESISNNFEGNASTEYKIEAKNIADEDVIIKYYYATADGHFATENGAPSDVMVELTGDQTYFGQRILAQISFNGTILTRIEEDQMGDFAITLTRENGEDYDYTTVDNYTLTITASGNYTGSVEKLYKVNAVDFNDTHITITLKDEAKLKYTYNGLPIVLNPDEDIIAIYDDGVKKETMIFGTDYELHIGEAVIPSVDGSETTTINTSTGYFNNVNAGTAMVFFKGKGNYGNEGYQCVYFYILKASNVSLEEDLNEYIYSGSRHLPTPSVVWDNEFIENKNLVQGKDFEVTYGENINAGTGTVNVIGLNNFNFELSYSFTIRPRDINEVSLAEIRNVKYNASAQEPIIVLSYNGMTLALDTDYALTFSRNAEITNNFTLVGTIEIAISGKGNYVGTKRASFTIEKQDIQSIKLVTSSRPYGSTHTIEVKVVDVLGNVVDSTEYIVTKDHDRIDAGDIIVTISPKVACNYNLAETNLTYTITRLPLTIDNVGNIDDQVYTGSQITPTVEVKVGETVLVINKDYSVSYGANINKGEGQVIVTGLGNYSGTVTKTFAIGTVSLQNVDLVKDVQSVIFDGEIHKQLPVLSFEGKNLTNDDYTIKYTRGGSETLDFTSAGEITITLIAKEGGNFSGERAFPYTISKRDLSKHNLDIFFEETAEQIIYTGSEITLTITGITLRAEKDMVLSVSDYTISYVNNVNAGTATLLVKGKDNFTGVYTREFTIKPRTLSTDEMTLNCQTESDFLGEEIKPNIKLTYVDDLVEGVDYIVTYNNSTTLPFNAGEYNIVITGLGNYQGSFTGLKFTVNRLEILSENISGYETNYDYTGSEIKPGIAVKVMVNGEEELLTLNTDYILTYATVDYINAGTKVIQLEGKGNFKSTGKLDIVFTIDPVALTEDMVTLTGEYVYSGSAIEAAITVANGRTLEFNKDYTVAYTDNINAGTATAIVTGKGNYTNSVSIKFTIGKANPTIQVKLIDKVYFIGDDLSTIELERIDFDGHIIGRIEITSTGTILEGVNSYNWKFVPDDQVNYNEVDGIIEVEGKSVQIIRMEIESNIKTDYLAYQEFASDGLQVRIFYNNGDFKLVDLLDANLKITLANGSEVPSILTVGLLSEVRITYTENDIVLYKDVQITIAPLEVMLDFVSLNDFNSFVAGKENNFRVLVLSATTGEPIEAAISYSKIFTDNAGNVVTSINASAEYNVRIVLDDVNYRIASGNTDNYSFYVKSTKLANNKHNIYATSEFGFEKDVELVIDEITDRAKIREYLGVAADSVRGLEKIYIVSFVKNGVAYTNSAYKIYINGSLLDSRQVYSFFNGKLEQVKLDQPISSNIIVVANEINDPSMVWIWIVVGAGVVLLIVLVIVISSIIKSKKRKRMLAKMQSDILEK